MGITSNQRETLAVEDSLTDIPFSALGNSATGAIFVEAKNTLAGAPSTATASAPTYGEGTSNPLSTDLAGNLRITGSFSITGVATAVNQTNASQKTQIVDGSGNVISSTANALDINIKSGNPTSITANAGTNLNTSLLAVESGGNLATLAGTVSSSKVNVNISSGNPTTMTVTQATGTNLHTVVDSGTVTTVSAVTQNADVRQGTAANLNATVVGTGTFAVQTTPTAPTTIYNGKKTVTTAGTRVTLAASQAVKSVVVKALAANTGTIFVGDASVASTTGLALAAGDSVSLDIANLATVNLDCSVNGEGVTYIATN